MKYTVSDKPIPVGQNTNVWPFAIQNTEESFSVATIEVDEHGHGATMNTISDRAYYVVSGEGFFDIADKRQPIKAGELMHIPKGTPYNFGALKNTKLLLLLLQVPAFDPRAEVANPNLLK